MTYSKQNSLGFSHCLSWALPLSGAALPSVALRLQPTSARYHALEVVRDELEKRPPPCSGCSYKLPETPSRGHYV